MTEEELLAAGDDYGRWLARTGLADTTKKLYPRHVRRFLEWVGKNLKEYDGVLTVSHVRDYAVRDYRRKLLTVDKLAPNSVELAVSAIGNFYDWNGLGKPLVKRTPKRRGAPKALDDEELRRALRAAERRGPRDYAIVGVLFYSAVRVEELEALDIDDVVVMDRSGALEVRFGKGGEPRQVPLSSAARALLRPWLAHRRTLVRVDERTGPLFLSRTGGRLSKRRIQSMVTSVGEAAGVHLSPHVFRHTFARIFLESGGDIGTLQVLLGHRNLASTQVYTHPTTRAAAAAVERVLVEP